MPTRDLSLLSGHASYMNAGRTLRASGFLHIILVVILKTEDLEILLIRRATGTAQS